MSAPNKTAILQAIKSLIAANPTVKALAGTVHIATDSLDTGPINYGAARSIVIRGGQMTLTEESTNSALYLFPVEIAAFDVKGDKNQNAASDRVIAIINAVSTLLHRNTTIWSAANQWIERARVVDIQPVADVAIGEMETARIFAMQPLVLEYQLYSREV